MPEYKPPTPLRGTMSQLHNTEQMLRPFFPGMQVSVFGERLCLMLPPKDMASLAAGFYNHMSHQCADEFMAEINTTPQLVTSDNVSYILQDEEHE